MQDISELQTKPYPNITLHVQDDDLTTACLHLTAESYGKMHLTVAFPSNYPLRAPTVRMDSNIEHPNIFGSYICASILNTNEGYTPAYTLKGIAIQLLSFFSSDSIEQSGGGHSVQLAAYRTNHSRDYEFRCTKCHFGQAGTMATSTTASESESTRGNDTSTSHSSQNAGGNQISTFGISVGPLQRKPIPDEVLLIVTDHLDYEELMGFAKAWGRIGTLITSYDIIRTRELQCFFLKKNFLSTRLGVGVSVTKIRAKFGTFGSEFDLLSQEGFYNYHIRHSVQGVPFQYWLPLPISYGHWKKVKDSAYKSLSTLAEDADLGRVPHVEVIFHFMNEIVVKLNNQAGQAAIRSPIYSYGETAKSTLTHASEKAIESYFHLFHLLLCLATSDPSVVESANMMLRNFSQGRTSKADCPNLGHLLVASLISDIEMTESILKSLIKEAVTRNVVWMLKAKPELSYLEPSNISHYRLQQTFLASIVSYRLLMFLNLFRRTAVGHPRKPLAKLRDEAFERHGAPPRGSAKGLADSIKAIHRYVFIYFFLTFLDKSGVRSSDSQL